jgi:hypothetical protein
LAATDGTGQGDPKIPQHTHTVIAQRKTNAKKWLCSR